jgi:translation initiation factor IF-1
MPEPGGSANSLPARVIEALPSALFRVELQGSGRGQATVHLDAGSGLLRVRPGDEVLVQLSPLDPGRGRIVGSLASPLPDGGTAG